MRRRARKLLIARPTAGRGSSLVSDLQEGPVQQMNSKSFLFFLMALVGCGAATGSPDGQTDAGGDSSASDPPTVHVFPTANASPPKAQASGGESLGVSSEALNSGHGINYHGGHVMTGTVHVYLIWYGDWSNNTATTILSDLVPSLSFSPYYDINTLYDDDFGGRVSGAVTLAGSSVDAYSHGSALTDTGVRLVVNSAIGSGALPSDPNGVYFVLTSSDVTQGGSTTAFCSDYCGWHTHSTIADTDIKYAFVGDPSTQCPASCRVLTPSPNDNPGADAMANALSHELDEAVTDPDINAWNGGASQENADLCNSSFGTTYTTSNGAVANMKLGSRDYRIQENWLNSGAGSCALSYGADFKNAVCGRHSSGINCVRSTGTSFGSTTVWQSSFSDADGWNSAPQYYGTIKFPDVNGDGEADVCGRAGSGIKCALSNNTSFGALALWQSSFSDAAGWTTPEYYSTIQYGDLNNDGKADVCGRAGAGIKCALSTGSGFGPLTLWQSTFSDAGGWNAAPYYSTIQLADINGDGMADVCGRGGSGMKCALSTGTSFGSITTWSADFSDANGWGLGPQLYSTIRLVDVNGDALADVCGRGGSGMKCALSSGSAFGSLAVWQPAATAFSDANGYASVEYYSTIQFGDLNADGMADVCSRAGSGMKCALSTGSTFGAASTWASTFSDAGGWNNVAYYSTIKLADLNRDGRADICGRGGSGMKCGLSTGSAFGSVSVWSSSFSDANGWSGATNYPTIGFAPQH